VGGFSIELSIDKITEIIRDIVTQLIAQSRADSVGTLVKDLGSLRGLESNLADEIETLTRDDKMKGELVEDMLNQRLATIYSQYLVIQRDFERIDPTWALPHALLVKDIGAFKSDGYLWYCPKSPGCEYRGGQPTINMTTVNALQLVEQLRSDAAKMDDLIGKLDIAAQQQASSKK
jgi:hypothetical protein